MDQASAKSVAPPAPKTLFVPFAIAIPIACLWLFLATTNLRLATSPSDAEAIQKTETSGLRLNPNTASPTDLALLPRIGEVTAQRIVAFREENKPQDGRPVFQSANDLERVRGIGPVTIARIERYLKFDSHCRIHE